MEFITYLWLPILLSSVFVFIASFFAWMVLPHHKGDWKSVPDEAGFLNSLRSLRIPAGQYMFPFCAGSAAMKDPEFQRRMKEGPNGSLIIWTGMPSMGRNLVLTFIFYLVVGVFVAYLTSLALPWGTDYLKVFQVSGTAAILAYCFGSIPHAIWFGKSLRSTIMDIIDGVVYGLLTAGTFGWLWPSASVPIPLGV
jgi:hypothetical protein